MRVITQGEAVRMDGLWSLIEEKVEGKNNIVWWGTGNYARKLFEATSIARYKISCVTSSTIRTNCYFFGIPCVAPGRIKWADIDLVLVGAGMSASDAIRNEILKIEDFKGEIVCLCEGIKHLDRILYYNCSNSAVEYCGEYKSFKEAAVICENGYDDKKIFDKVATSVERVIAGEACYERDSCLFYDKAINYPLMSVIYRAYIEKNKVNVLDIGGSLASSYLQNKSLLDQICNLNWTIFEQKHFVAWGKGHLENERLHFVDEQEFEKMKNEEIDIAFMSASIEYIEDYQSIFDEIKQMKVQYIVFDRIPIAERATFCVESVSQPIYDAKYPLKIFTIEEIQKQFKESHEIIEIANATIEECFYLDELEVVRKWIVLKNVI